MSFQQLAQEQLTVHRKKECAKKKKKTLFGDEKTNYRLGENNKPDKRLISQT